MRLTFTGRTQDLQQLRDALSAARSGRGATIFLAGEGGVGKTRLAQRLVEEAQRTGMTVAAGRAYPVETGVPYALLSDALLPLLKSIAPEQISLLARGGLAELSSLFPFLGTAPRTTPVLDDPAEFKTRLFWTFAEFMKGLSARGPMLVLLDDVHWADSSSLELLHFVARQTADQPIMYLCTVNTLERDANAAFRSFEKSLLSAGARMHALAPLTLDETMIAVQESFGVHAGRIAGFCARLYEWTKGNPFFVQETLQALIDSGRLRQDNGAWSGWEQLRFEVAPTIREAVTARLDSLSAPARNVAELAAVLGTRFDLTTLAAVSHSGDRELLASIDELRRNRILAETTENGDVIYDFEHPMFRQALYANLGIGRAKMLHGVVADSLEEFHGAHALEHANELAYHFARSDLRRRAPKAVDYLARAGTTALERHADREAVDYLTLALELIGYTTPDEARRLRLMTTLARARQRIGEFDEAIRLFEEVRASAASSSDLAQIAETERRLGLSLFWSGRHGDALSHFDAAVNATAQPGNEQAHARVLLARAACLQEMGQAEGAGRDIRQTLEIAQLRQDVVLQARAVRALALLYTWTGPPENARSCCTDAIALAGASGANDVLFLAHWTSAVLEGMTGHTEAMGKHIASAERLARQMNSPLMQLWTDELAIEHAHATGDWNGGVARGESAITLARLLNQRTLLPRLLVWTALMQLGRGELERARANIDEAWRLAGADDTNGSLDVHTVVPAHIGRASYHLAMHEFHEAIRIAERGLAVADRSGYPFWAIHRILPVIAEAYCHLGDIIGASRIERRMRRDSERLGHKLGLAWAQACRALISWRGGDVESGAGLMRDAVEALESIPILPDAARLRRQFAGRLVDLGDRAGALRELRHVHEVFVRLGAELELEKAREQLRDLGVKPPARDMSEGAEGLTGRELAIARLVARRKSNKAIGTALEISPRTVSTHLSNIFRKLSVGSRAELSDYLRTHGLNEF